MIEVKNLSKVYEYYKKNPGLLSSLKSLFHREKLYIKAVKNISFYLEKGELVGFLGPNGAGKTTTLKILSGILYPTFGEARILGYCPWERKKEYQKQFALVMGQKSQLWWDLPAMESFLLNKEIYEISDFLFKESVGELSELLEVRDILNIPVRKLSLGQRMKCELIAALLHNPKVLFLDEPTIGLDVVAQQNIREFLEKYNKLKKTTILLTSHYMDDVMALCKRVIIINQGEIIYDGLLEELTKKHIDYKLLKISFKKEVGKTELEKFGILKEYYKQRAVIKVLNQDVKKIAVFILTNLPVDDILIDEVEIEEVIRKIFKGDGIK